MSNPNSEDRANWNQPSLISLVYGRDMQFTLECEVRWRRQEVVTRAWRITLKRIDETEGEPHLNRSERGRTLPLFPGGVWNAALQHSYVYLFRKTENPRLNKVDQLLLCQECSCYYFKNLRVMVKNQESRSLWRKVDQLLLLFQEFTSRIRESWSRIKNQGVFEETCNSVLC